MADEKRDDVVKMLRMRAHLLTHNNDVEVSQTLEWLAAEEIERLRDTVKGLLDTLKKVQKVYPNEPPEWSMMMPSR